MRLKEIKPRMVVRCKNDDERKALLEEAEKLGYRWRGGYKISEYKKYSTGYTIHFYEPAIGTSYKYITWSDDTEGVTEFSDLIMPELTAEEAIKINTELCAGTCEECPLYNVDGYSGCDDLCIKNPQKAVEILAQWKSDHEKKEPEIEWVYRVFGAENFGDKFFQTEDEAIKRCEELAKSQKTKQYARYERVCRVKAVE